MASSRLLQELYALDRLSPEFHDNLSNILYGEAYKKCTPRLRDKDLVLLVDCLDKVRCRVPPFRSPLKLSQALDALDPANPGFRKCLRELRHLCGIRTVLPTSYIVSPSRLIIGGQPAASGGSGDIYQGTLDGEDVCVKRVRVYSKDGPKQATKVRHRRHFSPYRLLLTRHTDSLPGSCGVETLGTPKHRFPPRYYPQTSPTHIRVDVWRGSDGIHQAKPRRQPAWSCRCSPC